jgi:predicted nucleic acid-binding protein
LVDTNVLLDVFLNDRKWSAWSLQALEVANARDALVINPVIYAELSIAFARIEELEQVLTEGSLTVEPIPREALFLAGKAFVKYRKQQGSKTNVLPDFFVGAHAAITDSSLLTRDVGRYRTYFPTVKLLAPGSKELRTAKE